MCGAQHFLRYRKQYLPHTLKRLADNLKGSGREEDFAEDCFLLISNNQLVTLFFIFALPSVMVAAHFVDFKHGFSYSGLARTFVGLLLLTILLVTLTVSVLLVLRLAKSAKRIYALKVRKRRLTAARSYIFVIAVYPLIVLASWWLIFFVPKASDDAAFRTIYVLDGLSPLPVMVSVALIWFLFGRIGLEVVRTAKLMRVDPVLCDCVQDSPRWVTHLKMARTALFKELERFSGS